jgi:hypothetical protein
MFQVRPMPTSGLHRTRFGNGGVYIGERSRPYCTRHESVYELGIASRKFTGMTERNVVKSRHEKKVACVASLSLISIERPAPRAEMRPKVSYKIFVSVMMRVRVSVIIQFAGVHIGNGH